MPVLILLSITHNNVSPNSLRLVHMSMKIKNVSSRSKDQSRSIKLLNIKVEDDAFNGDFSFDFIYEPI